MQAEVRGRRRRTRRQEEEEDKKGEKDEEDEERIALGRGQCRRKRVTVVLATAALYVFQQRLAPTTTMNDNEVNDFFFNYA